MCVSFPIYLYFLSDLLALNGVDGLLLLQRMEKHFRNISENLSKADRVKMAAHIDLIREENEKSEPVSRPSPISQFSSSSPNLERFTRNLPKHVKSAFL